MHVSTLDEVVLVVSGLGFVLGIGCALYGVTSALLVYFLPPRPNTSQHAKLGCNLSESGCTVPFTGSIVPFEVSV